MAKKRYTPEQIINKLRKAEILLNQGATIAVVAKNYPLKSSVPSKGFSFSWGNLLKVSASE